MTKRLKIFILGFCFLSGLAHLSFASTNCIIENSSNAEVSTFTLDTDPNGSTTPFYVQLQQTRVVDSCGYCSGSGCACDIEQNIPNSATKYIKSTNSAGVTDSITVPWGGGFNVIGTLNNTAGAINNYRNATPFNIRLATGSSPSTADNNLDVVLDAGTTITFSFACGGTSDTAIATVTALPTTGEIIMSNSASLTSNTAAFEPNTDKVYLQVTDYDMNKNGYTAESVSVSLSALSTGDEVTLTLDETGANTGVFQYTTGVSVVTTGDTASTLLVSATGATGEIIATYTDGTQTANSNAVVSDFSLVAASPQTAGTAFALTITARDANGDTVTTYSGSATLTTNYVSPVSGTSAISPTAVSSANFTDGVAAVNVAYADAGSITITATDDTDGKTGTSNEILLLPDNFLVESTGGLNQIVNKAFNLKVTARNSSNDACPNYKRDVTLTAANVTPTGTTPTISPTTITGTNFSSGVYTSSMTYNKWGTAKITAADSGYSTVTGTTASAINFYPNSFNIAVDSPPASRSNFYLNEAFDITVSALDYNDEAIANYAGVITFTTVEGVELPEDYTFVWASDSGSHSFSISGTQEKTFQVTLADKDYADATGTSNNIGIIYAKIKVNDASGPIGTINTTVEIVDSNGDLVSDDDSTTFILASSESKANNSAAVSSVTTTVAGGKATISVTDTELESVTITPSAEPTLDIESGTVTFSTTAVGGGGAQRLGSGARILYWRELRSDER